MDEIEIDHHEKRWGMVGRDAYAVPLEDIDLSHPGIWAANEYHSFLERLRKEAPVHYCKQSAVGPYWSVTAYEEIMRVATSHHTYSSEPWFTIVDNPPNFKMPAFIAMDPPRHDEQRRAVQGAFGTPNLKLLEPVIRERVRSILDVLPARETFDWVEKVAIELTTQMLAILFDVPFEDRSKLTYWSDVATAIPGGGVVDSVDELHERLMECLVYFTKLWKERVNAEPRNDLVSLLAHGVGTRHMSPMEYLGNVLLLIVGGNDTTRNTISGGVLALNEHPSEYRKLRDNPQLIPNMLSEMIRWQTPLAYMRRTATVDTTLGGKTIRAGEKVVMWYASGNRDDDVFDRANEFLIDRPDARKHLAFGFGVHRCMGSRLAEMQLRILWEEILPRFHKVEVVGEPKRTYSSFVKGYTRLPVQLIPH